MNSVTPVVEDMRECITITAQFTYDCPAAVNLSSQSHLIHDDLVRLFDADSTTDVACTGLTIQQIKSEADTRDTSRRHLICATCGSTEIRADAYAEWDVDAQDWVLRSVFDHKVCEACESETTLLEIDEAEQLEIAGYGMVNDGDGARIAEHGEVPDFYDVIVRTLPQQSGEVFTLHEFDDLERQAAAARLAEMTELYPLAGVECLAFDLGADQ